MKYIVIRAKLGSGNLSLEFPLIFPNSIVHANMRNLALELCNLQGWTYEKTVAAGEVYVSASRCHGFSETLKLESRGHEDARLINGSDYGGDFS